MNPRSSDTSDEAITRLVQTETRRVALDQAIKVASECGEMDTTTILADAGKFADFMLEDKR